MGFNWNSCTNNNTTPPTLGCIPLLIHYAITLAFTLSGAVALILLIIAGIRFTLSQGGKEAEGARNMAVYAIIGLLVVLFSYVILLVISNLTNTPCILKIGFGACNG